MATRLRFALLALTLGGAVFAAQSIHEAPANAPSTGRVTPAGELGTPMHISGVVAGSDGALIAGASLYVYQTDHEGYYGVKPASDNRNPRLKLFLRSDAKGAWSFDTIRPGSYPNSKIPAHIHFEVSAKGYANRVFEIVFEGDPYLDPKMRKDPAFSVRTVQAGGQVSERIVMAKQ